MARDKHDPYGLSKYDYPQVLKDAHNVPEQTIDVTIANSLIPKRYSKVTWDLKDMGDGTFEVEYLYFHGFGEKEKNQIEIAEKPLGVKEQTTLDFLGLTPATLDGTYFLIHDDGGSVGVWFDLDNSSTPPTTGATRDIQVDISTGDSPTIMAGNLATVMQGDSEFTAASVTTLTAIESISLGDKTDATAQTSGLGISIVDGKLSVNNQYFYLYDADNTKFHVWFNISSGGTDPDPDPGNSTPIEVALTGVETQTTAAVKTAAAIDLNEEFDSTTEDWYVHVENVSYGDSLGVVDGNTGYAIDNITEGVDAGIIATLRIFFDNDNVITAIEGVPT